MPSSLVIGANGIIGSALYSALQMRPGLHYGTTQRASAISEKIYYLNITDDIKTWQLPAVDVVYVCAGICRMTQCEDDPHYAYQVNVTGLQKILDYYRARNVFFLYLSTNQVFSGEYAHASADAAYAPRNEYGRQKRDAECVLTQSDAAFAILRLTKIVEPNMPLFTHWLHTLTQNKGVDAFYDMSLAPVSLRQVLDTMLTIGENKICGIYQLSGAQDLSYYDAACCLAALQNAPKHLVQRKSAVEVGIKKFFLPRFTSLECSSTIALCKQNVPHFLEVIKECFEIQSNRQA